MNAAPFTREQAARSICSTWLRLALTVAETDGESKRAPASEGDEFVNTLLKENSAVLVGALTLPSSNEMECTTWIMGNVSWAWSEAAPGEAHGRCTSLRVNLEQMNLRFSERRAPPSIGSEVGEESAPSNETDAAKSLIIDPEFAEWLWEVSSKSEISIDHLTVHVTTMKMDESLGLLFDIMDTNLLSLFAGARDHSSTKKGNQESKVSFHRLAAKKIQVIHEMPNKRELRLMVRDYFGCGHKWSMGALIASVPVLVCQVKFKLLGISASRAEAGFFEMAVKAVGHLCLKCGGVDKCLKFVLQHASLVYCEGELRISLPKEVTLVSRHRDRTLDLEHVPLPFPVRIDASAITEETKAEDKIASFRKASISLVPIPELASSTAWTLRAERIKFGEHLELGSISGRCSVDATAVVADNFSVVVESASFEANDSGVTWLRKVIEDAERANGPIIALPYAEISSVKVNLFSKDITTLFRTNAVAELRSVVGEEDSSSSSLTSLMARRLMKEANKCRNLKRDRRADVADGVAIAAGSVVAGASMATPAGAAVGAGVAVASLGVRDSIASAVVAGKQGRGAGEHEGYRFGDFTRGMMRKIASTNDNAKNENGNSKKPVLRDKKRLAGVGGMSAGALVGTAVLGPVGFVAGSFIGSRVAKAAASCGADVENDAEDYTIRSDEGFKQVSRDSGPLSSLFPASDDE